MTRTFALGLTLFFACQINGAFAQTTATIDVDAGQVGQPLPPMFSGLMTEEINHAYDGGLNAELIRNRTFQDDNARPAEWSAVGDAKIQLDRAAPVNSANPVSLRVELPGGDTVAGVANNGYWGIPVMPNTKYAVSFYARGDRFEGAITAAIVGDDGKQYTTATTAESIGREWKKYTLTLSTPSGIKETKSAKFVLSAKGPGTFWLNLVSLFPPTYKDTPRGLRADLMKMMADLKPAFVRVPGGNYLEGDRFSQRFDWKKQIGPVDLRPGHWGCWGYRSSDGLGLTEMLLWCRQLDADPILGVFAGYTLNRDYIGAGLHLQPFVDEALEEIEYVTGGADTKWGKKRIEDGLKEPFKLQYVEVGNEDWFDESPSYDGRFTQFYDAIKAKYPNIKIIATAPVHSRTPDLYDDHFYQSASQMVSDAGHYDAPKDVSVNPDLRYDGGRFHGNFVRGKVPDVFVGEWATQGGRPTPTHRSGLADAVWIMGMERNSDLIKLQCYAPLFANVNAGAFQWGTNLIGYDALHAFGSPSYYAQVMIAQNRPDHLLPTTVDLQSASQQAEGPAKPHGSAGLGAYHTDVEYRDFSVSGTEGKVVLSPEKASNLKDWRFGENAMTSTRGVIKPSAGDQTCWGIVGDAKWTDYTINVKARKNGGAEGFIVLWHAADLEKYHWWNIGGWDNTRTQCEFSVDGSRTPYGPQTPFRVETGRWYDLRVEVRGATVRCYIDGQLVTEATDPPMSQRPQSLYASAGRIDASGEVVVRVVNFGNQPIDAVLNLRGAKSVKSAKLTVLQGEPGDVNTVDEPRKVAPRDETIDAPKGEMKRTFPPYSLTLIRLTVESGAGR